MKQLLLILALLIPISTPIVGYGQEPTAAAQHELELQEVAQEKFKPSLIKAIQSARKNGSITFREALSLRVACLSPAFVKEAQRVAIVQMAYSSQGDAVPYNDDGTVAVANIDWDKLLAFLEKLLPIILQLIMALGV